MYSFVFVYTEGGEVCNQPGLTRSHQEWGAGHLILFSGCAEEKAVAQVDFHSLAEFPVES